MTLALVGCTAPDVRAGVDVQLAIEPLPMRTPAPALVWRIAIDPGVPEWRAQETRRALEDWRTASPCPVSFEVTTAPVARVAYGPGVDYFAESRMPPAFVVEVSMGELPDGATGWGEWFGWRGELRGSRVAYLETDNRADFPRVVRHELGHAFNLPHNDDEPSLMCGSDRCVQEPGIMPADVRAFAALWCDS